MKLKKILSAIAGVTLSISVFAAFGCAKKSGAKTPSPHVHEYGEWQTVKIATFEECGEERRVCKDCGEAETRAVSKREERSFGISYDLDGGEIPADLLASAPTEYKNTDEDLYISIRPHKRRYVFKGWATANEKPMRNYVIKSGSEGDITLIARYAEDDSKYYDGGDAEILPDVVSGYLAAENKADYLQRRSGTGGGRLTVGDTVTVVANKAGKGKKFVGWVDDKGNVVSTDAEYTFVVSDGISLFARYEDVKKKGLSGGAIAGITVGCVAVVGIGGLAVLFVVKKKTISEALALIKGVFTKK